MNTPEPTTTVPARPAAAERYIALATTFAPIITGVTAPLLDGGAAFAATLAYGGAAGFLAANYMNRLPGALLAQIPAADIVRAHRSPLFVSTLTTGVALALGSLSGPLGADVLLGGILDQPSIPGIVSLGWWAAVGLVPYKLRTVLKRRAHQQAPAPQTLPANGAAPSPALVPFTPADEIYMLWARHISDPAGGTHKGQELIIRSIAAEKWEGTVTAPLGTAATVTEQTISSVFQVRPEWVFLRTGGHVGERHVTVYRTAPPSLDITTLAGAWAKYASRSGGVMAHTHLTDIQDDPNTGGQVALVVADETIDKLPVPDRATLAGALRTTPLLVSYEQRQNPREGVIRIMDRNPLQDGVAFPGTHVLKPNANGYIQIGRGISGFPTRIQIFDPALGAQHVLVAGVTGSGKGGTLQLIALAHHINGSAIINADPKGSSNPAIDEMAAYSGLGPDGAIGALRIWYSLLRYRVAESARLGLKNFRPLPERPYVPLILDEANSLLGESAEHRKEAVFIAKEGARLGRSLGMPVILANQLMQLAELGGEASIRDNIAYGGSLVLLRSDSQQRHLVDLPANFAGCNPADIPAAWSEDRALIFDPDLPENDPRRTFGLGFAASPGGFAEMMRNWLLEDATPYIDKNAIAYPADWPDWDRRDEIAATPVVDDGQAAGGGGAGGFGGELPSFALGEPKKPASAEDKILAALGDLADPAGIEVIYSHKDRIGALAGIEGSTLDNALSRLVRTGKVHRQVENRKTVRGYYGLGPGAADQEDVPSTEQGEDAAGREVAELLPLAVDLVVTTQLASASMLQRKLRAGWQTVQSLLSVMEQAGVVTAEDANGRRDVTVDAAEYEQNLRHGQTGE
ncbi:DNA translocase FtsK [Streptomyces sp. NPDC046371]|uniref:type IV secretory system conjugative DNA transfer family protein n=1 Tax=Streptomyces sp. NPDC046371 TaxID=3154916 RepID=UPI0033CB7C57